MERRKKEKEIGMVVAHEVRINRYSLEGESVQYGDFQPVLCSEYVGKRFNKEKAIEEAFNAYSLQIKGTEVEPKDDCIEVKKLKNGFGIRWSYIENGERIESEQRFVFRHGGIVLRLNKRR